MTFFIKKNPKPWFQDKYLISSCCIAFSSVRLPNIKKTREAASRSGFGLVAGSEDDGNFFQSNSRFRGMLSLACFAFTILSSSVRWWWWVHPCHSDPQAKPLRRNARMLSLAVHRFYGKRHIKPGWATFHLWYELGFFLFVCFFPLYSR